MSDNVIAITEEELHAFIDGEVEPQRAAQIATAVQSDSTLARQIAAFREDKLRLRQAYSPIANAPLPEKWLDLIDQHAREKRIRRSWPHIPQQALAAAAAILLLIVSLGLSREFLRLPNEEQIINEALAARDHSVQPERSFTAADFARADKGATLLTAALASKVNAPNLTRMGYRLESVRIYPGRPGSKAVELDYRNMRNGLFTLYLRRPSSPPRVDIVERGRLRICLWQDDELGAVMAGEMPAGEMARLASLAYSGLTL
jgi:anti-sigma factor RsiW